VFFHYKGLQFEASPERPDPVFAMKLQELIGGHWGEMTVAMQYLFQGWNCRIPGKYKDMLMDIGTEEIGHVEMLSVMLARLLEGAPAEVTEHAVATNPVLAAVIGGMDPQHGIVSGGGARPTDSRGNPWSAAYITASGNLLADFRANAAAEAQGRLQTARLYNMTDDPGVKAMLQFNLARDTVHQKQWLAAIEELEADGLEDPIVPTALFDEEDQEHNHTIWHLSDGPDGNKGGWSTNGGGLDYLMDPQPLGGPGTAPKPDPTLYATYAPVGQPAPSAAKDENPEEPGETLPEGAVETYFEKGAWKNKVMGNARASNSAGTKAEATAEGREMAIKRGVEHFIRTKDGTVGERKTYSRSRSADTGK
jgi:Mn-containing catalase